MDPGLNVPDLGSRFVSDVVLTETHAMRGNGTDKNLSWSTVLKRTFEAYVRGDISNMYGEFIVL